MQLAVHKSEHSTKRWPAVNYVALHQFRYKALYSCSLISNTNRMSVGQWYIQIWTGSVWWEEWLESWVGPATNEHFCNRHNRTSTLLLIPIFNIWELWTHTVYVQYVPKVARHLFLLVGGLSGKACPISPLISGWYPIRLFCPVLLFNIMMGSRNCSARSSRFWIVPFLFNNFPFLWLISWCCQFHFPSCIFQQVIQVERDI